MKMTTKTQRQREGQAEGQPCHSSGEEGLVLRSARLFILVALLAGACSKSVPSQTSIDPKAFDSATPAVQQAWANALDAAARNDYGTAIMRLRALSRQGLPVENGKTVYDAIVIYENKLRESAKNGDAEAKKTMQTLGVSPASHP